MWVVWTLVIFAVLGWFSYAWLVSLFRDYHHTLESWVAIVLAVAAGFVTSYAVMGQVVPGLSQAVRFFLTLLFGIPAFAGYSFLIVSIWKSFLTRDFDERIASLEEESEALMRRLETMRFLSVGEAHEPKEVPLSEQKMPVDELERLRRIVDEWQEGGGAARVRSLKVAEWRELMARMSDEELQSEVHRIEDEASFEADEAKREQDKVRLALAQIEIRTRHRKSPDRGIGKNVAQGGTLDESDIRQRLHDIHWEVQRIREHKIEFLRSKVTLSWRVKK